MHRTHRSQILRNLPEGELHLLYNIEMMKSYLKLTIFFLKKKKSPHWMGHSKCFLLSSIIWMSDNIPQTQMAAVCMVGMKAKRTVLFSKSRLSPVARVSFPLSLRYFHLHEQRLEMGNPSVWKDRGRENNLGGGRKDNKRGEGKGERHLKRPPGDTF